MMSWFKSKSTKHPEEIKVPKLRFLGEQDGVPGAGTKRRPREAFPVRSNYLEGLPCAGCLQRRITTGSCSLPSFRTWARPWSDNKIGKIFASMFGSHEHLDIIFLDSQQEYELAKVCSPFFGNPKRDG